MYHGNSYPQTQLLVFFGGALHLGVSVYKIFKKIGYYAWPDPLIHVNHGFLHRMDIKDNLPNMELLTQYNTRISETFESVSLHDKPKGTEGTI